MKGYSGRLSDTMSSHEAWYEEAWEELEKRGVFRSCAGSDATQGLCNARRRGLSPADAAERVAYDYFS